MDDPAVVAVDAELHLDALKSYAEQRPNHPEHVYVGMPSGSRGRHCSLELQYPQYKLLVVLYLLDEHDDGDSELYMAQG